MATPTSAPLSYTMTSHEASGTCTLYGDQVITGVLNPTGQPNVYTTAFIGGAMVTLTVPGSNSFVFSFQDGSGTSTDNAQLGFDLQSHSVSGSDNWTHTDGCAGLITLSGSWTGGNVYSIPISIIGATTNVTNVQVCATVSGNATCGANGGFAVGQSSTIAVTAASGASYVINVPSNQPAASFCSVTSGGSGILGSSITTAVVSCQ